jgi:hypothetical protein
MPNFSSAVAAMTPEERAAAVQRVASWQPNDPSRAAPSWSPEDILQGLAQARLASSGLIHPARVDHPLATGLLASLSDFVSDADMVTAYAGHKFGVEKAREMRLDNHRAGYFAVASAEISELYSTAVKIAIDRRPASLAKVQALTLPVQVRDFKAAEIGFIEVDNYGAPETGREWAPFIDINLQGSVTALSVGTLDVRLRTSLQSFWNNQAVDVLTRGARSFQRRAYANELRTICQSLDANGNLDDGSPWFSTDALNLIESSSAPDATGLAAATAMLRSQTTRGGPEDLDGRTLLVPANQEITARGAVYGLGGSPRLDVISSQFLSGSNWYVFADPQDAAAICRLTLEGANGQSVDFSAAEPAPDGSAIQIGASHHVSLGAISRLGVVRIEF